MSLALKLDRARQDLEYWQKIAEDPLSSSGVVLRKGIRLSGAGPPGARSTNTRPIGDAFRELGSYFLAPCQPRLIFDNEQVK
jgi:hypothetical protein